MVHSVPIASRTLRSHHRTWRNPFRTWRQYSSDPQSSKTTTSIKVGLKSSIPLTIHHAPRPSTLTPTILYLPRGPLCPLPDPPLSTLALSANATVVCIDYRISIGNAFPTPIHDILAGYDWVQNNLIQQDIDLDSAYPCARSSKIGVCGELIGGGLATALALTECRPARASITAACVGNPIADWTSLTFSKKQDRANRKGPLLTESLLKLREDLFRKPEHYHDPFASPLLFFRTPAISLPDLSLPHELVEEQDSRHLRDPYALGEDVPSPLDRKRRSHRKYPPAGSALRLPYLRIDVGADSELAEQGHDMVDLLIRSVRHWEDESYGELGKQALKEKIELVETENTGLWGEKETADIGRWMGKILRL